MDPLDAPDADARRPRQPSVALRTELRARLAIYRGTDQLAQRQVDEAVDLSQLVEGLRAGRLASRAWTRYHAFVDGAAVALDVDYENLHQHGRGER